MVGFKFIPMLILSLRSLMVGGQQQIDFLQNHYYSS